MNDLISRQAAIDAFEKELSAKYNRIELAIGFIGVKSILQGLPSAQPEPNTGYWKRVSADRYTQSASYVYRCSECGETHVGKTRYCPHCGVYMKGDE